MDLVLWRHAEAEDGFPDSGRRLTKRGRRQAKKMAEWLDARLPDKAKLVVSPAARARETAEALGRKFSSNPAVDVGASPDDLLAAAGWPHRGGTVVVVGHQPTLGEVAARLLAGTESEWSIRKGAVWWFSARDRGGELEVVLTAVMPPELL
ncbi:MAG: histidine phosphatase family protein [Burkholderiales bacterium]|nr:histidine phosphatase family protein [Burkholderiales bacterium]